MSHIDFFSAAATLAGVTSVSAIPSSAGLSIPRADPLTGRAPEAVRVIPGEPQPSWLVVASPHSGRHYPAALLAASRLDLRALRKTEDAWVDLLMAGAPATGATLVTTDYARCWLDLNRAEDELGPQLIRGLPARPATPSLRVQAGLGVIPRTAGEGGAIYRHRLGHNEAEARIAMLYRPYHAALDAVLANARQRHGACLLLDCHSMPSGLTESAGVDVVLGDRFGTSCARQIAETVAAVLQDAGLTVDRNAPFAGGHVTSYHGHPGAGRHALQIELRRDLYMDEATLEPHGGFDHVKAIMDRLIATLATRPA